MNSFLDKLNPMQREAVLHTESPLIIFAGAGTGKTRVITFRIAYLLSKGVSPHNIVAVTFTNKAAEEMRRRVDQLVPGRGRMVWISTFHSFCANFLRVEAKHNRLNPDFLIYDTSDSKSVLRGCISELNLDDKKFKPGRLLEIISRAKDDLLDADSYAIHSLAHDDNFRQAAATIYKLYQKKLNQAGAFDFGDLLLVTNFILRENQLVREKYQERFHYVLVDEYQDTNHAQYMLSKYLSAKHKNICVVGDDDQSIYSWRGADIRNILEFERDYPGCRMIKLEQNYRSTPNILSCAWQVVQHNQNRVEKKLWTENSEGEPLKIFEAKNEIDEAEKVVNEIENVKKKNGMKLSDFAVFYRTNAQSRVLEDAFRRSGIPYTVVGTVRFYERAEVKDILSYLRLIHNTNDDLSFKRIINVPRRGIGKASFLSMEHLAQEKGISLWGTLGYLSSLEISRTGRKALSQFKKFIDELRADKDHLTVKEITSLVLEKTGYLIELESEDTPEARSRIENIYELVSAIDEFEHRSPDKSLSGYLTQVSLISDIDEWTNDNDKATLMTLHLAKGLEFKTVFVTGLEEGLLPIGEAAFSQEELEEERRLMYVGMTRAKEHLYLSWAYERKIFGKSKWNMPSCFIEEAGGGKIQYIAQPSGNPYIIEKYKEFPDGIGEITADKAGTEFSLGTRVRHEKFGEGKVIDKSGSEDDLKLVILFDSGQWKKILVKYAKIEKI